MDTKELLRTAAETINRLGSAAQDCKTCAKLTLCNAYCTDGQMHDCQYEWIHAKEAQDEKSGSICLEGQ